MNQTFQNSAQVLSIGIFFTLMIVGLSSSLPQTLSAGLEAHGVAAATAHRIGNLPPVSILFAAFLGYNPIEHLLGVAHARGALRARSRHAHRAVVLPAADLRAVPLGAPRRVRLRDLRLCHRVRGSVLPGRWDVPPRRRAGVGATAARVVGVAAVYPLVATNLAWQILRSCASRCTAAISPPSICIVSMSKPIFASAS